MEDYTGATSKASVCRGNWRPEGSARSFSVVARTDGRLVRNEHLENLRSGRRITLVSVAASGVLAFGNIAIGMKAGSTSVVAAGLEFLGDVLASLIVFAGMSVAAKPADEKHPYGYGRFEILAGLVVGLVLTAGGVGISWRSLQGLTTLRESPSQYAVFPLIGAICVRSVMSWVKFRVGNRIKSGALVADAWNDTVDVFSAAAALIALSVTLSWPERFLAADQYGGVLVGLVVVFTGLKVLRDAARDLADVMPDTEFVHQIRSAALKVPGVLGVEKCYARKSGLQYYVDLHLEVDGDLPLWRSHEIGGTVRTRLREELDWVADILVHVEPAPKRGEHSHTL